MKLGRTIQSWLDHAKSRRPNVYSPGRGRRRRIAASILLVLLIACSSYFWYFTAPERVRGQAIKAFHDLTGADVELDHASLGVLEGIRIKGLRIYLPTLPHNDDNLILVAEDVLLVHRPISILMRRLELKHIVVHGARLKVWYDHDRGLSSLHLLRISDAAAAGLRRPTLNLRQTKLVLTEIWSGQARSLSQQEINGMLYEDPNNPADYKFDIACLSEGALPGGSLEGVFEGETGRFRTSGTFMLQLVDFTYLPRAVSDWMHRHEMSQPSGVIATSTSYDPKSGHCLTLSLSDGFIRVPVPEMNLPLTGVSGAITCTRDEITINGLRGRLGSYCGFNLDGVIYGYDRRAPFDVTLETEGLAIPPDQWDPNNMDAGDPNSPLNRLPSLAARFIRSFKPTGLIDLKMHFSQEEEGELDYDIKVTARDAGATCRQFPYPLENVGGMIQLEPNRVSTTGLTAQQGPAQIEIDAQWVAQQGYRAEITARGLLLDEKLHQALPATYQDAWRRFSPSGTVNATYVRWKSSEEDVQHKLMVELLGAGMQYEAFPVPLAELRGKLEWFDQEIAFDFSEGIIAGGSTALAGTVRDIESAVPTIDCRARFDSVLLSEELMGGMGPSVARRLEKFEVTGAIAGTAHIYSDATQREGSATTHFDIDTTLSDGRITHAASGYELAQVQSKATISDKIIRIHSLTGVSGQTQLALSGHSADANDYQWRLEANPLELSAELVEAAGEKWPSLGRLNPTGLADITLDLQRRPDWDEPNYLAQISPRHAQVRPSFFDYPFENITGSIVATPASITIDELTSRDGTASIAITGTMESRDERACRLKIKVQALELTEQLQQALPSRLAGVLERFGATGLIDLDCAFDSHEDGGRYWQLLGDVSLNEAGCRWPFLTENLQADFTVNAQHDPTGEATQLKAEIKKAAMLIDKRPIERLSAQLAWDGPQAPVTISEINGTFCDGRIAGKITVGLDGDKMDYTVDLKGDDINVAPLLEADKEPAERNESLRGRFAGWFSASGASKDERRGKFLFVMKDAVLGDLPLAARILHVLNLSLPTEGAFNAASISGNLVGRETQFDEIKLKGSALSLTGTGVMRDPNNTLDLVFVVDPPSYMENVPVLSSFIKAVRPAVMQVRATGPFEDPKVTPVALPILDDALRGSDSKEE